MTHISKREGAHNPTVHFLESSVPVNLRTPILWDSGNVVFICFFIQMGVSKNRGTPKSSILGFSIINHPFWDTPILGNTHKCIRSQSYTYNLKGWKWKATFKVTGPHLGPRPSGWPRGSVDRVPAGCVETVVDEMDHPVWTVLALDGQGL